MLKYAAVFPGQGSQSLGMLKALGEEFSVVADTFGEASDAISTDLWAIAQSGPLDELNATHNTQPIMLAAGVAVWRVWNERGGCSPTMMAGHSLGEYSALVCSGALDFSVAVSLVAERGRQMQAAVPDRKGAMAAILGLDDAVVIELCVQAAQGQVVAAVNFNSPGQVVIAGAVEAVDRAISGAKQAGAKRALKLPVSVPSHCDLMRPAVMAMTEALSNAAFLAPEIPVIHNVDVSPHDSASQIRTALIEQLYRPVRWSESVQTLAASGASLLLEFGPGKVLAGLTKRIDRGLRAQCVQDTNSLDKALSECRGENS